MHKDTPTSKDNMRLQLVSLILACAKALVIFNPIETVPICTNENTVPSPLGTSVATVSRIAWPISEPSFDVPITVNGIPASEPPTIICMNCASPPCFPVTSCDVPNLYWSTRFDHLVVPPGHMVLPNTATKPITLITFYEEGVPIPTSAPTPTAAPSPSSSPSITPPPSSVTQISPCELCAPCDKSSVVGIAVSLGFIFLGSLFGICAVWHRSKKLQCVYCSTEIKKEQFKKHLFSCSEHLRLFNPIIIDTVKIIKQVETEDREDEVAHPEVITLVPTNSLQ
jgi:hypothetical protein